MGNLMQPKVVKVSGGKTAKSVGAVKWRTWKEEKDVDENGEEVTKYWVAVGPLDFNF